MSWTKQELSDRVNRLIEEYGEWTYDIPLLHGVWTRSNEGVPHTRLKRVLQIAGDLSTKPLNACRILDLGCLDGQFSIEFALAGAEVIGVEVREANIQKALFAKEVLQLEKLKFLQDDVRNISRQKNGTFDVIVCSGILYHLNAPDVFTFIERMYEMAERLLIIDTHISLLPETSVTYKEQTYFGRYWREWADEDLEVAKRKKLWASWGNPISFQFTRPSLVNFLSHAGFTSAYECFNPPHLNYGQPGVEHKDRCTFVAVKGRKQNLVTSPAANSVTENHPEGNLSYASTYLFDRTLEKLFAGGAEGVQQVPWISTSAAFEFRLYAGTERKTLLGAVKVTRSDEPFIVAAPNPVPVGEAEWGTTTISWSTGKDGSEGQVYLAVRGQPEKLFAGGAEGSQEAPWISTSAAFEFRLYAGTERKTLLGAVKVTRSDEPFIVAAPNPVPVGEAEWGTTTISWSTGKDGSEGQVYVSIDNDSMLQ